jgi:hypothetical protein
MRYMKRSGILNLRRMAQLGKFHQLGPWYTPFRRLTMSLVFCVLERAMGIEPTRAALHQLENKRFGAIPNAKCDWRVNFRGMWGHVGLRGDTRRANVPGSSLSVVDLRSGHNRKYMR